jgi:hypothetical protein
MNSRGKTQSSQGSKGNAQKSKANESAQAMADEYDFSRKFPKHYKYDDMFSRVHGEVNIHSNLSSVVTKLNNEGTLDELYENLKRIFENEVGYALKGKKT